MFEMPMPEILVGLHRVILVIADEIDRICSKYSIPYSIGYGTLLGAVRHKGFIPWDDDFDVFMTRNNYEKFKEACKSELDSSKFFLQTEDTEPFYPFAFAKLQLAGTELLEDFSKNVQVHHGISVDIFALDHLPKNYAKEKIMLVKNKLLKNMIWLKCGYGTDEQLRQLKFRLLKAVTYPIPLKMLRKLRNKTITRYNQCETDYLFCSDYPNDRLPVEFYADHTQYQFEDRVYQGPCEYDKYLTLLYGDYMELPPVEDRKWHSNGMIRLGKYNDIEK